MDILYENNTAQDQPISNSSKDANDAVWILTSAFLIFSMQSGYALLESGIVSRRNEVHILVKSATNVLLGSLSFWCFGYALSFGQPSAPWISYGDFFLTASREDMGKKYAKFFFQLAYATTSTTFVSGAVAERCKFTAYCVFSLLNTLVYSIPAGWMYRENGFLKQIGALDIGGSGTVHLVGGCCGFIAAIMLGPRLGRYDKGTRPLPMGNPTNALMGLFMLWWGWLGFSAGSTFGIENEKWKYSSRAAVTTILASIGGGMAGMTFSIFARNGIHDVAILINAVLGSLVAISGGAAILCPWQAIVVGSTAALLVLLTVLIINALRIDDPTNTFAVHGVGGLWGLISIGLFTRKDNILNYTNDRDGLFVNGQWRLLASQTAAAGVLITWSTITSALLLVIIRLIIGLRVTMDEEILGPDFVEHKLEHHGNKKSVHALADKVRSVYRRRSRRVVPINENAVAIGS